MRTSLVINAEAEAAVTALRVVMLLTSLVGVVVMLVIGWVVDMM